MKRSLTPTPILGFQQLGCRANDKEAAIITRAAKLSTHRTRNPFILFAALESARKVLRDNGLTEDDVLAEAGFKPTPTTKVLPQRARKAS